MPANGTDFDNALSAGYLRLARDEQAEADYVDADYFAARAITTANALIVLPPEVNSRDLPQGDAPYVLAARNELVEVLDGGARIRVPQLAASSTPPTARSTRDCRTAATRCSPTRGISRKAVRRSTRTIGSSQSPSDTVPSRA